MIINLVLYSCCLARVKSGSSHLAFIVRVFVLKDGNLTLIGPFECYGSVPRKSYPSGAIIERHLGRGGTADVAKSSLVAAHRDPPF